jgi:FkbM family methyltransferase
LNDNSSDSKKRFLANAYHNIIKRSSKGYGIGKRKPIKKILGHVQSFLKTDFAEVQGSKMYLDPNDSLNLSINGVYGELDTRIMKEYVLKNDIVIDVGANIGYYTLLFSRLVGEQGKVLSFEPEPKNFEILKKNIEINAYKNVQIEQVALSDKNGEIDLFVSDNMLNHKIYRTENIISKPIKVKAITLDDYVSKHELTDKINFIKIDVEGAELKAMNGMKHILQESKKLKIFTEFMFHHLKQCGSEPKDLVNLLLDEGFEIHYVDPQKDSIVSADLTRLTTENTYPGTVNLFCTREKFA